MDAPLDTRKAYSMAMMTQWLDCGEAEIRFRKVILFRVVQDKDTGKVIKLIPPTDEWGREVMGDYVSKLTTLWGKLENKINGCGNEQLKTEFSKFSVYLYSPQLLYEDIEEIFKLSQALSKAVDQMKLTQFEEA